MRFVDLFAGLGGFHLAAKALGGQCVFACEIEGKLRANYEANFGIRPAGDIKQINPKEIPKHDLLCAGFPCQPFSKAGGQMGWNDSIRGTVFYNIVEILKRHRPQFVVLENVAHFVKHDEGNTYARVKESLESLGYEVRHAQLSPHKFGVPQIRERMYMVGRLGGLNGFKWPHTQTDGASLSIRDVLDVNPPEAVGLSDQVIRCLETWQEFLEAFPQSEHLPSFPIWSMEFKATYPYKQDSLHKVKLARLRKSRGCFGQTLDTWLKQDVLARVPSYARGQTSVFPHWKQAFIRQNRSLYGKHQGWIKTWLPKIREFPPSLQKLEWNCHGEDRDIWKYVIQFRASGVRIKRPTTSPSLVAMTTTQVPIIGWERRYMTVRECARLQSMDDLEHLPTRTSAMAALGNAVNVKVARLVLQKLLGTG
ncbi:MAG: DNA (cytosine-5-)-methyltransferase [Planctomycetes bacterium B3_Pla]|nr:MAG: DNA (cytosine-5-)-methyltransferase [Planctomycetes bacterium B3_Pla]